MQRIWRLFFFSCPDLCRFSLSLGLLISPFIGIWVTSERFYWLFCVCLSGLMNHLILQLVCHLMLGGVLSCSARFAVSFHKTFEHFEHFFWMWSACHSKDEMISLTGFLDRKSKARLESSLVGPNQTLYCISLIESVTSIKNICTHYLLSMYIFKLTPISLATLYWVRDPAHSQGTDQLGLFVEGPTLPPFSFSPPPFPARCTFFFFLFFSPFC